MANPFFAGRIPPDLDERIKQHCAETGENKTQLLINALSAYLNHPIRVPTSISNVSIEKFNELEQRVIELEKKLEITSVIKGEDKIISNESINPPVEGSSKKDLITTDNKHDIDIDPTQLSVLDSEKIANSNHQIIATNEVPKLPGLEKMNSSKIKSTLRNAKNQRNKTVRIGQYIFKFSRKEPGIKGALLWEVITTDNA